MQTSSTTKPYPRAPLILSLAQVRFSPVMQMGKYVPDIQDILRHKGYPHFTQQKMQQIAFGLGSPDVTTKSRWFFASEHKRDAIVLTEDFLVYETSKYISFEFFAERMHEALDIVKKAADINLATRVGIRTIDYIRSIDGIKPRELIHASIRGLDLQKVTRKRIDSFFVLNLLTEHGTLSVRAVEPDGGQLLPPDLETTDLTYDVKSEPDSIILDFDHSSDVNQPFESEMLMARLHALHHEAGVAFRASVTPQALELWKKPAEGDK